MRVRIHRGAREIGGSCVEIDYAGDRILLDIGRPLVTGADIEIQPLDVQGLSDSNDTGASLRAIFISHPHIDHYGLIGQAALRVPVYIGEAASRIVEEAGFFMQVPEIRPAGFLKDRETIQAGPFKVTPYHVDHSAYDSYALLVEAGGRRLFYTGDFRAHGRTAWRIEGLVASPPKSVDVLLMEGTLVHPSQSGRESDLASEAAVEEALQRRLAGANGIVLVAYSPQNIDRFVSIYKAARATRRTFVADLYAETIARATGNERIPHSGFSNYLVYVTEHQRAAVKSAGELDRVNGLRRIYKEDLAPRRRELVMTFRESMSRDLAGAGCLDDAVAVWSMWRGYLENDQGRRLKAFLDEHRIPLEIIHTSGHATVDDLQRIAAALSPGRVVPIHTFAPDRFKELFDRAELHADGEWWDV